MKNKKIYFQKIPLAALISSLIKVWEEGAEFVDIGGEQNPSYDTLCIDVRDEYFLLSAEKKEIKKLTDEELNKLI